MAGLENLFATEPTLPNVQKTKMPENVEKWAEVLTTLVREQFADIAKNPMTVEFKKKDDQSGTAIGAVRVLSPESEKAVYIPFIIDKFQLHPLDIWMESKTQAVHALTKDTFKEVFFVQNFAEGLDARPTDATGQYFNDPSTWSQTYPPLQGRYSYASAGYKMLDEISDTIAKEDLDTLRNELKESPMLLQKFEKRGHKEIVQKLIQKTAAPLSNDFKKTVDKLIPTSYVDIRKNGTDKYSILLGGSGLYDLAKHIHCSKEQCEQFLSSLCAKPQDILHEVDECGEKQLIIRPAPEKGVWLYDKEEKGAVSADEFTCYIVKNKNGLELDAVVIPQVVDFAGRKVKGKMVLSKTHSSFQDSVAGIRNPDSGCLPTVLKPQSIRTGQMGTFVHVGTNGKAIATMPVTIQAIENGDMMHVVDGNGKKFRVRRGWGTEFKKTDYQKGLAQPPGESTTASLESLGFVELKQDHLIIPEKMMWIPMEPMTEVCSTPAEWLEKTAAEKMDMDPVEVRYTGIVYEFRGHGLPKIACDERQARALLINLGADLEKAAKVMLKAKRIGKASVHGCQKLASRADIEKRVEVAQMKVAAAASALKKNFIKEAAEIENQATVDVVLALGFLNRDNLAKFISYVPVFEKCSDFLAELTLGSRLGLKQVDESATTGAMMKILEVIEGLKKIEGAMKKPTTKAA